jgi:two-component system sensor histidine kinase UhpB
MRVIRQFLAGKEVQQFPPGMLLEKIREDLRFMRDSLGLEVILETLPEDFCLPESTELIVYHILREGFMNIIRHSHASRANLFLKRSDGETTGCLKDNGVGFEMAGSVNDDGLGLSGMKDRIKKAGGESSPGHGTKISFVLPLSLEAARPGTVSDNRI